MSHKNIGLKQYTLGVAVVYRIYNFNTLQAMERDTEMHYLGRLRYFAAARGHLQMRLQIRNLLKEKPEILQVGIS